MTRRESNPMMAAVYALIMAAVCIGGGILCCLAPRLVEWR